MCEDIVPKNTEYSLDLLKRTATGVYERLRNILAYEKSFDRINTPCILITPKSSFISGEDYKLDLYVKNLKVFDKIDGDHTTVLSSSETIMRVHEFFGYQVV